ncbi:MAG: MipA/OmpV family protein [Beijerinckiaceae bacterium]|nr:MipA/OmpV family protein [Beijerinckiaceae bacterium]
MDRMRITLSASLASTVFALAGLTSASSFAQTAAKPASAPAAQAAPVDMGGPRWLLPTSFEDKGWLVTVKGNFLVSPNFPGSNNYSFSFYPSLSVRRTNDPSRFGAPDDGISIGIYGDEPHWTIGIVGRYQQGRYVTDNGALAGIQDARWAAEPGIYGEYWLLRDQLRFRGEVRYGFYGYNGFVGRLGADVVQNWGRFAVSAGPRLALGGSDYMQTYYGVSAQDAQNNKLVTPYKADPGVVSVGAAAAAYYVINDNWSTTVYANYDRLVGSAQASPIVRTFGSPNQFTFGTMLNYSFAVGQPPK